MLNYKLGFVFLMFIFVIETACITGVPKGQSITPAILDTPRAGDSPGKSGWESEWDSLQANAKKEGRIVVYGAPAVAPVRNSFIQGMKKFGVEAEIFVGTGGEFVNKVTAQRRAGIYGMDVYVGGGTTLVINLIPAGYIDPLEPQLLLPEVKESRYWRPGELPWVDKNKSALAFAASPTGGVVINSSLVKQDEISSFLDLLNPKWKGNIVMNDPTVTGTGLAWFSTTDKLMGRDYIKNLALQKPVILRDQRLQVDWIAMGKYPVGVGILYTPVEEYIGLGAPLKQYLLKEGSYISSGAGNVALINKAAHPNASKLFINWLLSKTGQTIWSTEVMDLSQRLDVAVDNIPANRRPDPKMKYLLEYTEEAQLEKPKYMELARELFSPTK